MIFVIIIFCIAFQVFLSAKKVSPFISLLIVAILSGFLLGMGPNAILQSVEKGVGSTLGGLALIICLGAALGKILEVSGAAEQISTTLIQKFGEKNIQWAVLLTGFIIGIPLYYNAGFIILVPLVFTLARKTDLPVLYIAIPMAASLSTTHCFLPPHPGPTVLVNAFNADLGTTLLLGLVIAIPSVILAGPIFSSKLKGIAIKGTTLYGQVDHKLFATLPSVRSSFLVALLPVILITVSVISKVWFEDFTVLQSILLFLGDSTIAILLSVLLGLYIFGVKKKIPVETQMKWIHDSISGIAVIILIITAGGVFKQVLIDSGTGDYIASFAGRWKMHPLLFAWMLTAVLRVTLGSATVAGITAAGLVSSLVSENVSPELMVLAVGAGSVFGSHINDSGFWMFKEFFQLTLRQTLLSWTIMESIISLVGLIGVLILSLVV